MPHSKAESKIMALIETVHRLRAPGGCPWDREQTHQSLRPFLIEEAYEVLDVLDKIQNPKDLEKPEIRSAFQEEMGDLLMQVLLHSEMANEVGAFSFEDVAQGLNDKLIRRHPHVFGDSKVDSADAAYKSWEKQKAKEKKPKESVLEGLPKGLPALQKATRTIEKVSKVGFQWSDLNGPLEKLDEELGEFKSEVKNWESEKNPERKQKALEKIQSEMGDLLFSICNVGHFLGVQPEDALRGTLERFDRRFRHVESRLKEQGKSPENSNLEEMDRYWNEAKRSEK